MAPAKRHDSRGKSAGSKTHKGGSAKRGKNPSIKREKTKFHAKKFAEKKQQGGFKGSTGAAGAKSKPDRAPRSAATKHVDLHLASKISHEFANDINQFKSKLQNFQLGKLDLVTDLVPPSFIMQHLPSDVSKFRTYFPRFLRGSSNHVLAFLKWFEWAEFEVNKGKTFHAPESKIGAKKLDNVAAGEEDDDEDDKPEGDDAGASRGRKISATRAALAETVKEREHVRALLHMCLRHNSTKRRDGQHALINHLNSQLAEHVVSKTATSLRDEVHQSIYYALSRLLLGMATENFAHIILNCQVIQLAVTQTSLAPKSMLAMIDEVLTLDSRMKAVELRLQANKNKGAEDEDAEIDPEDINDPTKGERNQRIQAAIFAIAAVFASDKPLTTSDVQTMIRFLCFCFVEHKGLRVFSANLILKILRRCGVAAVNDPQVWKWLSFTFFHFQKLEYFRPEGVQLLLFFMSQEQKPQGLTEGEASSAVLRALLERDPLQPTTLEELANALFRKEQVTLVHPMVHPVWQDLLDLIQRRCAEGESMKQHLTTLVHTVIAPYRRGSADSPRRALFQKLVDLVGKMALLHDDEEDRSEVVKIAVKTVGFGKHQSTSKPTDPAVLRNLTVDQMNDKVQSLLRQLVLLADNEPGALHTRSWALKELKSCLLIPVRDGVATPYVDAAVLQLLQHGLFPAKKTRDEASMNRATYLFAETFSFTMNKKRGASMLRPKTNIDPTRIISSYLEAEEKNKTRFRTAVDNVKFRKARNKIVTALDSAATQRSVLFYESRDILVLFTLLFILLSVDDPTNEAAIDIAKSVAPDLAQFFVHGTIETLDLFYDAMMALVMRTSVPTHAVPIMSCIRRIATGLLIRFASFLKDRRALDIVLAPLVEAFSTNAADDARNRLGDEENEDDTQQSPSEAESSSSSSSDDEEGSEESSNEEGVEEDEDASATDIDDDDDDASTVQDDEESASSSEDEEDADADDEEDEEVDEKSDKNDDHDEEWEHESENSESFEEEEQPTQQYLNSLQQLAGNVDLGFAYPPDVENREKSTALRAIHIAARVGLQLRSPIVVHVYQVLLAVMRATVKQDDPVIFNGAKSAIEMLLLSRQRYFGHFLAPQELFQILGDIQSNLRKLTRLLVSKEQATTRRGPMIRKRMNTLKQVSLQVMHFLAYLAQKNHAGEPIRITFSEFYASVYYDRGWETKSNLYQMKRDLYHYRHAFAWAFLPAVVEKFMALKLIDGAKRVTAFNGVCAMIEATLPRVSGLTAQLKLRVGAAVSQFFFGVSLADIFTMKQTALYNYFRALKFAVEYNSKLQMNLEQVAERVDEVTDKDELQVTAATIRIVATLEKLLNKTPRVKETKAPVPVQVLHRQFQSTWKKAKSEFYKKQKAAKRSVSEALLAHRNNEPTDEERAKKRRRREDLKVRDHEERKVLREERNRELTKEEKDERRKRMEMAKQDRIAKNKERKKRLRDAEARSFQKWKAAKLEE